MLITNRSFYLCFPLLFLLMLFCLPSTYAKEVDAELVKQHSLITIKNNKVSRIHSYEICIYNRNGEEFTEIELPFSKMIKVSNINAYIKDAYGQIIKKIKKNDIKQRSAISSISLYEDNYVYEFTLKHNQYPYTIYLEYEEQEDQFFFIENWFPYLGYDIPTKEASLSVTVPKDYKINYYSQLLDEVKIDTLEEQYTYNWETSFDGKLKPESLAPTMKNYVPYVSVVPENFTYEIDGSLKNWQDFGLWQHNLIKDLMDLPEQEISKVKKLVANINDTVEVVKTLFHYLQDQTRYINITIETGGLKPYPASYVAHNRYGDCKALSNYFKALLNAIGIKSYYSKINAGETIQEVNMSLPSQQSNHIILCIPNNSDTLWVDCTSDGPFGYTGTFIQNREVFVIDGNNSFFTKTPKLAPDQVLNERLANIHQSTNNETIAHFQNTYRGEIFEILQMILTQYNDKEKEKIFRDNIIAKNFEPIEIISENMVRDSTDIQITYKAKSNNIYKKYGNDLLIKILSFDIPKTEKPDTRKFPVQIDYPIFQKDYLVYEIPDDYQLKTCIDSKIIKSKYGEYHIASEIAGKKVKITKSFFLSAGKYPIEEYADFYNFLEKINQLETNNYITSVKQL